jgi:phosphoribosylamine--glycine ligase
MNRKLRVLLLGGGGREHAIANSLQKSENLAELKVFPGNGGFDQKLIWDKPGFHWNDKNVFQASIRGRFDFVFVGPEDPLVNGVADWCNELGIPCFGPSAFCAQIEGSKDFAKNLMKESRIPTAEYETFSDHKTALEYVRGKKFPLVVKADGLAAGKGVTVCTKLDQAELALREIFEDQKFGRSGSKVVIEDFLVGEEASLFVISDGENYLLLPAAQDHKRAYDNDEGPNTGGMGAYCPAPIATESVIEKVRIQIIEPLLSKFREKGEPYKGLLYCGLMIHPNGDPYVVEFNCRFGDPETQAVLLLVEDDLLAITYQAATGTLPKGGRLNLRPGFASVVVLAAEGYPGDYKKGIPLDLPVPKDPDLYVFHAGTKWDSSNRLVTSGGRILGVSAYANTLKESVDKSYGYLNLFSNPQTFYRRDIARRAL